MIDVEYEVNATQRQVGRRTLEAGEAKTVTITRTYRGTLDEVWDACTNPERIKRWFLPVEGDLKLGGRYQLEGNAGGTIETCDPPNAFTATWEYGGDTSWIELNLTAESDDETRFELIHIAHVDDRWTQFGPGAVGIGWDLGLLGLSMHLGSGESMTPAEGQEWAMSDEGKQFMSLSGDAWCDADIAGGADEPDARARSARTIGFYTGAEAPAGG